MHQTIPRNKKRSCLPVCFLLLVVGIVTQEKELGWRDIYSSGNVPQKNVRQLMCEIIPLPYFRVSRIDHDGKSTILLQRQSGPTRNISFCQLADDFVLQPKRSEVENAHVEIISVRPRVERCDLC